MSQTGTYILLLHLPADTSLTFPHLGKFTLPAGFYAYVGSAFGPGGLPAAFKRHLTPPASPHTPIDHLQQVAALEEIWFAAGEENRQHVWADLLLAVPGGMNLIEGFGTDDCDCDSHLVYFDVRPDMEDFAVGVRYRFPAETIARAYSKGAAGG
ncbi:MAG: GIY-YIG nuclease family protein [Caldilineae bacterium]|nr:MAG: GIY-YIG nuclease family protein [Caldilineae bacterium]